ATGATRTPNHTAPTTRCNATGTRAGRRCRNRSWTIVCWGDLVAHPPRPRLHLNGTGRCVGVLSHSHALSGGLRSGRVTHADLVAVRARGLRPLPFERNYPVLVLRDVAADLRRRCGRLGGRLGASCNRRHPGHTRRWRLEAGQRQKRGHRRCSDDSDRSGHGPSLAEGRTYPRAGSVSTLTSRTRIVILGLAYASNATNNALRDDDGGTDGAGVRGSRARPEGRVTADRTIHMRG